MADDTNTQVEGLDKDASLKKFQAFHKKYWPSTQGEREEAAEVSTVISTHLYIENSINELLDTFCRRPSALRQLDFEEKVRVLEAFAIISDDFAKKILSFNRLRNKYAHNLEFKADLNQINSLNEHSRVTKTQWDKHRIAVMQAEFSNFVGYVDGYTQAKIIQFNNLKQDSN